MEFDDARSRSIEASYAYPDFVHRRALALRRLDPRSGERVLDLGCGPGVLTRDLAAAVGPGGRVLALDASESMLGLARARCAGRDGVELVRGDVGAIPAEDGAFDGAVCLQVYEYVQDVDGALREAHRALRPGGRLVVVDTDWRTAVWNHDDPERMRRVLAAWDAHLVHPSLPGSLTSRLEAAGFRVAVPEPFVLLQTRFNERSYGGSIVETIRAFVPGHGGVTREEADAWAADLRARGEDGRFFFSLNQYLFVAEKG